MIRLWEGVSDGGDGVITAKELWLMHSLVYFNVPLEVVCAAFNDYKKALVVNAEFGRQGQAGQQHHNAKLSAKDVEFMRILRERHVGVDVLANVFGVTKRCVGSVCRYERWTG